MCAVKRWPDAWRPMLERDDHVGLMLPIITCDAAEQVEQLLRGQPDKLAHVAQAYHHIPEAVRLIHAYWRQHKPQFARFGRSASTNVKR